MRINTKEKSVCPFSGISFPNLSVLSVFLVMYLTIQAEDVLKMNLV
jgi:hypothetical protein